MSGLGRRFGVSYLAHVGLGWGVVVLAACGGRASTEATAGMGSAGSAAAGAANGGQQQDADLPSPPDDSCRRYAFTFAPEPCPETCPPPPCEVEPSSLLKVFETNWCELGTDGSQCRTGFDCSLATEDGWFTCLVKPTCHADGECGEGQHCVVHSGNELGECETGINGARCRSNSQCQSGHCVASTESGVRTCSNGDEWSYCNHDDACLQHNCVKPDAAVVGICSIGAVNHPCHANGDCTGELKCVAAPPYKAPIEAPFAVGLCSAGEVGNPCGGGSDCATGFCPPSLHSCSSGELDGRCDSGADCASGFCGPLTPNGRACVSGEPGAACDSNDDCKASDCVLASDPNEPIGTPTHGSCS